MSDIYSAFALPHEVIEAVRSEEARMVGRLADVPYEVEGATRDFRRAVVPMLLVFTTTTDAEGEPTEDWMRDYAARRAALEADSIVTSALQRQTAALSFATEYLRDSRRVFHEKERQTRVQQKA